MTVADQVVACVAPDLTITELQYERENSRRQAWDALSFPMRLAAVSLLGWPATYAWCTFDHFKRSECFELARISLEMVDECRRLYEVVLPDIVTAETDKARVNGQDARMCALMAAMERADYVE